MATSSGSCLRRVVRQRAMEVAVGTDATVAQDGGSVATTLGPWTVESLQRAPTLRGRGPSYRGRDGAVNGRGRSGEVYCWQDSHQGSADYRGQGCAEYVHVVSASRATSGIAWRKALHSPAGERNTTSVSASGATKFVYATV